MDHCGVNFFVINLPTVRDLVLPCALPFRLTAHLPALSSQSRHLPPLVARPFSRNPTPIPSTRVLVPLCRFSRYEGSPAPPTSTAGRVTGVVGRRGGLLCVISRAAGCSARCDVRSATVGVSVAVLRYLGHVSAGGGGGGVTALCTRHSCYQCASPLSNHHKLSKQPSSRVRSHSVTFLAPRKAPRSRAPLVMPHMREYDTRE